jgi:tRNA G37 N-methylase Trm5
VKYYSSPKKAKKTRIVLEEGWIVNRAIAKTVRKFEVLASKLPTLSRLYMYPYKNVVKREIELANLEPGARVLQIGAGSVPYTALYLASLGGFYVTALDIDPGAVKCAADWVERMGFSDRIRILCTSGNDYSLEKVAAAFLALQVEPKEEVMDYLMARGEEGLKVIVREPSVRYASQYDPIPEKWRPVSRIYQGMSTFTYSNLYIKS